MAEILQFQSTDEHNPYFIQVSSADGTFKDGDMRIEPPISMMSEKWLDDIGNPGRVRLVHDISDNHASILEYTVPIVVLDRQNKLWDPKERLRATAKEMLSELGFIASREIFANAQTKKVHPAEAL